MMQFYIIVFLHLFTLTGASGSGIVGGRVVKPHSRPYMVSLQVQGKHVCGGILVKRNFVLTSAHCKQSQALLAVLGAHNITKEERNQQRIPVAESHRHPKYKYPRYDIMLLKLKTDATLDKYVKVIGLPKKNGKIPANIKCSVAGWGRTGPGMPGSEVLREVTVKMQFSSECKNKWSTHFSDDQMICTRSDGRKGFCQGDSGGPLICNSKPTGIVAFTKIEECDDPKYPYVFMKIPFFISWIKKEMHG